MPRVHLRAYLTHKVPMYSPRQRKCAKRRRKQRPPVYVRERKIPRRLHEKAANKAAHGNAHVGFEHERLEPSKRHDRRAYRIYQPAHQRARAGVKRSEQARSAGDIPREHNNCRAYKRGGRDIPTHKRKRPAHVAGTPTRKPGQHEGDKHQRGEGTDNIGNEREGGLRHETVARARLGSKGCDVGIGRHCARQAVARSKQRRCAHAFRHPRPLRPSFSGMPMIPDYRSHVRPRLLKRAT